MREVGAEKVNQVLLGEEPFDDPGFTSAAEKMNELYENGILGENPLEDGEAEANAKFLGGRAAMRLTEAGLPQILILRKTVLLQTM